MRTSDIHRWLGRVSGGTGPIFRWVWVALIAIALFGLVYGMKTAMS